jgi:hypothetical protein
VAGRFEGSEIFVTLVIDFIDIRSPFHQQLDDRNLAGRLQLCSGC